MDNQKEILYVVREKSRKYSGSMGWFPDKATIDVNNYNLAPLETNLV